MTLRQESQAGAALPTFLMIGATKCGTTSMHHWLSRHPQVFMHPWKEMRFFVDQGRWARGTGWYAEQFTDRGDALAWGEASNGYTRGVEYRNVPERAARTLPDARFLYIVREPMSRLVSHYRHRTVTGREWRLFDDAVRRDPAYVATGLYGAELARWQEHIAADRILVVPFEALARDPRPWLDRVAAHIGVDPAPDLPLGEQNVSRRRRPLPRTIRRLGAVPAMRPYLKRLGNALSERWPPSASTPKQDLALPPELARDVAERFAADRKLLEQLAGPEVTRGWT